MKKCKKCLLDKDILDFYKHKAVCKACYLSNQKEYNLLNIDKVRLLKRNNYSKNREKYLIKGIF